MIKVKDEEVAQSIISHLEAVRHYSNLGSYMLANCHLSEAETIRDFFNTYGDNDRCIDDRFVKLLKTNSTPVIYYGVSVRGNLYFLEDEEDDI